MDDTKVSLPLQLPLLRETQQLAQELNVSWPRLVVLALQEFVYRYQRRKDLLASLSEAYGEEKDEEAMLLVRRMRSTHRRLVEGEW